MEEIDIIELLKRVKEGKAPRKIEVMDSTFEYNEKYTSLNNMYLFSNYTFNGICLLNILNNFDTKIKILDKPIIEELDEIILKGLNDETYIKLIIKNNRDKINEIIRYLRSKDER